LKVLMPQQLNRYTPDHYYKCMLMRSDGEFVRWSDVAAILAEVDKPACNTGSPKFPTLEDVRKGIVAAGVCSEIGLDMNNFGVGVAAAHSIICRQLRAGA